MPQEVAKNELERRQVGPCDERVAARFVSPLQHLGHRRLLAEQNDPGSGGLRQGLDPPTNLEAIDTRPQLGREQDEIEAGFPRQREAERSGLAGDDLVAPFGQAALEDPPVARIIVDDEQATHGTPLGLRTRRIRFVKP
jgi:hypothetical protein